MSYTSSSTNKAPPKRPCEHPKCQAEGTCRAPKTRALDEYYWFCPKHAAEYNKSWNYYAGMSYDEVERENRLDEGWRAPTWKFGVGMRDLHKIVEDPLGIYNEMLGRSPTALKKKAEAPKLTREQAAAVKLLGVKWPCSKRTLSAAYKKQAKLYHPDVNGEYGAEDRFKQVAAAYALLAKAVG